MNETVEKQRIASYIDCGYWKDRTLGDFVGDCARSWPDRIALVDDRESLTYSQLDEVTDRVAGYLAGLGMERGDRVLLQMKNDIWHTVTWLAVTKAGAVPIMTLCTHRLRELVGFARKAEPVMIITNQLHQGFDYPRLAYELQSSSPSIITVLTTPDIVCAARTADALSAEHYRLRRPSFTDVGVLTCSGGSTSVPKLIPRRHADYLYDAETFAAFLGMDESDAFLVALPASHNFVLGNPGALGTMTVGGTVVMCGNPSPDEILPMIDRHRVTTTALVPTVLSAVLDTLSWDDGYDLSCMRRILVGGSVFEEHLARRAIRELPGCLHQVFGTAEGINFSTTADDPDDIVACSQGKAISEADEWLIVDEHMREVPHGESGELIARGPYTIQHYYRAPEAEDSFTDEGFYRTGDKAHVGPRGYVVVEGRVSDQINRSGEKIMPSEIEGYLTTCPGIEEVQVVGVPDELFGQRVHVYAKGEPERIPSLTQVNAYLADLGVAAHKRVDRISHLDEWPLTSVGKIDRKLLCVWGTV